MQALLELLEQDCTQTTAQLAQKTGMSEEKVQKELTRLEENGTILGYQAIIDWNTAHCNVLTALIQIQVVPQGGDGFDRIARRIYQHDEVESVYLMSGSFDLTVVVSGSSLRTIAQFVGERLATLEGVTGISTHFILKKYKEKGLLFHHHEPQEKEFVFS